MINKGTLFAIFYICTYKLKLDFVGGAVESSVTGIILALVVFPHATANVRARRTFRLAWIHSCT